MKTIIYATDCSNNDASSLKYAYRFSCIMNANLHVLHVYEFPPIGFSTILPPLSLKNRMHEEKIELVDKYCKTQLKNEFHQKPIVTHVLENSSVSDSILRLSKILNPDLIIIGMRDAYSKRGYFSGNIANTLLDTMEIPLLIVPNTMVYDSFSTIVYATDFEQEDIDSILKLVEIARPFEALIEIVHVYEIDKDSIDERMWKFKNTLLKQVSYPEITFRTIASSKIKHGLLSVIDHEKVGLLAMLERKHDWSFNKLFHKDLVKDMEDSVAIPILAFNNYSNKIKLQNANTANTESLLVC